MPVKKASSAIVPVEMVQQHILIIRSQRVIIDADLARLYGVTTKRLNEAVKRNKDRFPADFMFRLSGKEAQILRSQIATLNPQTDLRSQIATSNIRGGRRYAPYAFTEHGAIMTATVLNSPQAVSASLFVVRAFIKLRELLSTHQELAAKLNELEHKLQDHDGQILDLFDAIRQLMAEPDEPPKPPIGYQTELAGQRKRFSR